MTDPRRALPSVDRLLGDAAIADLLRTHPRSMVVAAVREALEAARTSRTGVPADWAGDIAERLAVRSQRSLRPVLNATGVVLHTNLGRAPLAGSAAEAIAAVASEYSTLEYDLASGTRGHRSDHCRALLRELSGAEDGLAVNNAAAALVLALSTVAAGRPVLISRGELIEIGGSFRIPEILATSGAQLLEVGTTNRTHLDDYHRSLEGAAAILTVHRSNFEQKGFVTTPPPAAIAEVARAAGIPYLYDIGSGLLADLAPWGLTGEPKVQEAVAAGADLVLFSGDKLLGGPQSGCLVGHADLIDRCRRAPFARAVRLDRLTLAALEATLVLYRDPERARREIPVLRMLTLTADELSRNAGSLLNALLPALPASRPPALMEGESAVGGGSFPGALLPTTLVAVDPGPLGADGLALRLRLGDPPVITRVAEGRVLLDPRTLPGEAFEALATALRRALEE